MNITQGYQKISSCLKNIDFYIKKNHQLQFEKYVQLGSKTVRLLCYSKEFIPFIEKQLSYNLKSAANNYSATIVVWNEKEVANFISKTIDYKIKIRLRIEQLARRIQDVKLEIEDNPTITKVTVAKSIINHLEIIDYSYSKHNQIINMNEANGIINAYDQKNNIYYYGVKDLHPEEFIKQGHIFVQIFNKIIKTPTSHLAHGAVVGLNNNGILFCARGQKGKSTLAVLSMMHGFDYVSDDYLVLEKEGDELYSYPIYSIITLSPRMYNELYDDLKGKFVSNNARKDKYVIDIKNYHHTFRNKYPIKICMFPQIVSDEKPSIVPCKKGQAITQLIHSTIIQLEDKHNINAIKKLISFVKDFNFYQINLSSNIKENVVCLKQFTNQLKI